ncbi:MAG: EAL domain-containing protein [gamma proteobacterium symbiont of Bathyaustriella thionipta]|nr:EAL domain-containing protein [gamma proteobacterium symbiont of Bathyaustriella thionipta]MCU7950003.1 EAL domain-containing protein [gamma proteobacterium symbiont of Bathyaustriella thionipta]MCU7952923.1 EAL domain-containing protein [gamma proteobacterium symbiont of Bathyaustriella thionipta]MCU7956585.1 EAL domain-containing protein [gamma proteobacterium symbiont of Bathyaustriella thionipta]MCU7968066.1 EAL domain-containing protein [gamma proteobacterium symbiont of Bathyaustriella
MNDSGNNIKQYYSSCLYKNALGSDETKTPAVTILVADDEKLMRESVQELLSLYNLNCLLAEDGQEALDILAQQPVDILLLDLIMPKVDGFQVMKEVRTKYPDTDIIITSGEATFKNATLAMRHGVKDFLHKPYIPSELVKVINNLLEKQALQHQVDEMTRCIQVSEERYRFFVNNSPDMVYMLDKDGHFIFVNERATELLGYEHDEFIGRHYSEFIHKEDVEKAHFAFSTSLSNLDIAQKIEFKMKAKYEGTEPCCFESRSIAVKLNASEIPDRNSNNNHVGIYGVARDVTEQKRLDELIYFQLYHDALTNLPNRILFRDRINFAITQANRSARKVAIMFLDMDRFKIVNDSLGHIAGDKLLQKISKRLLTCIRDSDTLARVGGDEFNLMLPDIRNREDVINLINKITLMLEQPFNIEGNDVYVTFSIGTALYPDDGTSSETLIKHADMAMYNIKGKGKNGHEFFSDHMQLLLQQHLSIENGIRLAIQEDQFEVYFQPQYNTKLEIISGVEALIRWNHPEKGLVSPNDFIPLAEETGLINDIGEWMLDASCKILQNWIKHHSVLSNITLAVNISASQISTSHFVDFVLSTLKKYNLKPEHLELEITENTLMKDMDLVVGKLKQLSNHGVRFAVDDFGMGYSSLSYLQTLPLNNLKIDRSFISTIQSVNDKNSIITAIVAMAKELGMNIVAEGVENEVQINYVKSIGCPTVQGYWYGRPMPAEQLQVIALQQLNELNYA